MKPFTKKSTLLVILSLIVISPLVFLGQSEFMGSDSIAEEAIVELSPNYEPWFNPIWQPPSGEIESFIFSIQAAMGTGVLAYYFGYMKGKRFSAKD